MINMTQTTVEKIASLLSQAGNAHHHYEQTVLKGVYDLDWHIWYAEYALEHGLGNLLDRSLTLERLSEFLSQSNEQYERENTDRSWADYTAQKLVESF